MIRTGMIIGTVIYIFLNPGFPKLVVNRACQWSADAPIGKSR